MALPDSGQPEDYTEEEMTELLKVFDTDKDSLSKQQKAAVARYNFKKGKGVDIAFRAPGTPPPAPAAKDDPDAWKKFATPEVVELSTKDPATLERDDKIALAKGKSQAMKAMQAAKTGGGAAAPAGESKEEKAAKEAREKALATDVGKAAAERFGDAVDFGWQTKWPYIIVKDHTQAEAVATWLRDDLNYRFFATMTAVDYPSDRFDVVYNLFDVDGKRGIALKLVTPRDAGEGKLPEVPSLVPVWRGADWYEREVFDLFGVRFAGHPNLKRIMMPEGWEGYPLRKDYDLSKEQFIALGDDGEDIVSFNQEDGW